MTTDKTNREKKFHLAGWILFMVCAVFFIASSVKTNSVLSLVGSIIFLIACAVFIIPLVIKEKQNKDS